VKAKAYQDGHAGYSDPIDEQNHLVLAVNAVMKCAYWKSAAIIITYDDSDGRYDQVMSVIVGGSANTRDRCAQWSGPLRRRCTRRLFRTLRLRPAVAASDDFSVCPGECGRSRADRPEFDRQRLAAGHTDGQQRPEKPSKLTRFSILVSPNGSIPRKIRARSSPSGWKVADNR
jgi:hypothetical protein